MSDDFFVITIVIFIMDDITDSLVTSSCLLCGLVGISKQSEKKAYGCNEYEYQLS